MSKYKLINDPVHGFITVSNPLVFQILEHSFFQRLRRISQMGLAHYVYPGTRHTRFHHALGAMHLMQKAISVLKNKGISITKDEEDASLAAILLHDIGHGPYSHALEYVMTEEINHEFFSELIMKQLNEEFNGRLNLAIDIFNNNYPKTFLHQLVSSQLDVDRLDYLARDSFFSGVYEGKISTERIISMLNVVDNYLVVEEKGIYSVEKYIISRRLMYWQVYLHKTALAVEQLMVAVIKRAKELAIHQSIEASSKPLNYFLENQISRKEFKENPFHLQQYCLLDDYDVMFSIKEWMNDEDEILSFLSKSIVNRNLYKIRLNENKFSNSQVTKKRKKITEKFQVSESEVDYFLIQGEVSNLAYQKGEKGIKILTKKGKVKDLAEQSEQLQSNILNREVKKYFLGYPKKL